MTYMIPRSLYGELSPTEWACKGRSCSGSWRRYSGNEGRCLTVGIGLRYLPIGGVEGVEGRERLCWANCLGFRQHCWRAILDDVSRIVTKALSTCKHV